MTFLSSITKLISRAMYIIAGVALTLSMFLTVCDVVLRTIKHPITGTFELVGLLGAVVIGFSLPETSRMRGHVIMHFLTQRLPHGPKMALHVLTRLLAIGTFALIAWNLVGLGDTFRQTGETTPTLQLPFYPVCYGIAACCFVECLVLFVEIFDREAKRA
ncbi:MAG: TRAP transporter small permease [Desulfomonilaceae bacterium]